MKNSSLQKQVEISGGEMNIEEMPAFLELVKKIMMRLSGNEYLDCQGVIEGNSRSLARQLRSIMKEKKCDVEQGMEVLWKKFEN